MMAMVRADLAALNITHEVFFSERSLVHGAVDQVAATIAWLRARGHVYEGRLPPPKGAPVEDWEDREQTLFRSERLVTVGEMAAMCGTDAPTYTRERPGMSTFVLEEAIVYHTYSTYARGLDGLWGMYQWLDRAPLGRNETGAWWRRHDEYTKH